MSDPSATSPRSASGPVSLSVGGQFIEALRRRDFAALADCLDSAVRLRAVLPYGPVEVTSSDDVAAWFQSLFGGADRFEVADATVGELGPRLYMRWRINLQAPGSGGQLHLVEQHAFADSGERIRVVDLLCSGFIEATTTAIRR